ncbi:MAG: pantetheine-phosphate adenylyltransferase [Oligoflexia bacterium]|nr:pantetheine-phosphate adenylyltransferase [Oligoflexia bacterium]
MGNQSIAVFPGSFDPLTNGHVDIVERSLKIFDRLVVAVLHNPQKQHLFSVDERVELLKKEFKHYGKRTKVLSFSGLLVDFAKKVDARVIVRGLRAVSDYEYEMQMALMNRHLRQEMETVFLITNERNSYISSTMVKGVAMLGGSVHTLVPRAVEDALLKKLKRKK